MHNVSQNVETSTRNMLKRVIDGEFRLDVNESIESMWLRFRKAMEDEFCDPNFTQEVNDIIWLQSKNEAVLLKSFIDVYAGYAHVAFVAFIAGTSKRT